MDLYKVIYCWMWTHLNRVLFYNPQDGAEYDEYGNNRNRHRRKRLNLTEETIVYPVLVNKIKKYNRGY